MPARAESGIASVYSGEKTANGEYAHATAFTAAHRTLPFGTWFEFVINQQGDVVRRRLSWFSPLTDHALFVNQRGQRVGEQTLDSLARAMAQDQARIVTAEHSSLVDRAWHSALTLLRGFINSDQASGGASA